AARSPAYITGLVVSVVVDSINLVASTLSVPSGRIGGAVTHILQKRLEGVGPALADHTAPTASVLVLWVISVVAARLHVAPGGVQVVHLAILWLVTMLGSHLAHTLLLGAAAGDYNALH